jgi:hypothetical protein
MKHKNAFALDATIKLDKSEVQFIEVELSTIRWPQGTKVFKEHYKL